MAMTSRFTLACVVFVVAAHCAVAQPQRSLAQLRKELIAPWLLTLQGDPRTRLLRISEIAEESEGAYLFNATYGWTDGGSHGPARVELIRSKQELLLIVRTPPGGLLSVRKSASGEFVGTYKPARGAEKQAKLERLTEEQIPAKAQESLAAFKRQAFANEDKDWGVPPTKSPRAARLHAPTPTELPGAKTIRATELRVWQEKPPAPLLIDVLGGDGHRTIPGAHWLREAGAGSFGNAEEGRFRDDLGKLSGGRKAAPIVFFCLSSQCWLSYNAGLRALEMGYTNVYWFRGGIEAWQRAGFETREAEPYRR